MLHKYLNINIFVTNYTRASENSNDLNLSVDDILVTEEHIQWEKSFKERTKLLTKKGQNKQTVPLEKYFKSFSCLSVPSGVSFLEQDFHMIISDL